MVGYCGSCEVVLLGHVLSISTGLRKRVTDTDIRRSPKTDLRRSRTPDMMI